MIVVMKGVLDLWGLQHFPTFPIISPYFPKLPLFNMSLSFFVRVTVCTVFPCFSFDLHFSIRTKGGHFTGEQASGQLSRSPVRML